ncbi:MAG TPA: hypothetical protein EYG18_02020 [Micavibrio sp.]|jgi:hypothetical protein|nr:hypothetical protein [Pseudomonadota bacterium]HIF26581.1 hypothetical protein [Micavibrio sp.]HIL28024.1 hypothetical protein [Micavibrio sp.]
MTEQGPSKQQQNMVKGIILFTGVLFMFVGAAGLVYPSLFSFIFEDDVFMCRVLGGSLLWVGISDLVVAKLILFKGSDRV